MNAIEVKKLVNKRQLHKFGGSSLLDVNCYLRVAGIMAKYSQPNDIIVVSAAGSTTNQLINWLKCSQSDRSFAYQIQKALRCYHSELIKGLLPLKTAEQLLIEFVQDLKRLAALLKKKTTDACYAEVVGHGEIWSARLMAAVLNQRNIKAVWIDSREFLCAERAAQPKIDKGYSYPLLQQLLRKNLGKRLVVTGFISRNHAGETVLLGRNGSDYSATQIAALAAVVRVTIWSDVAGVHSADPRKVKDAFLLPLLRFDEASELARLAASVLHARTLQPVFHSNIDLQLRCSYRPEQGSTRIKRALDSGKGAKIITSHDNICLIELYTFDQYDFKLAKQKIDLVLKRLQIQPIAMGTLPDRNLLQLCYTSEVANSIFRILQNAALPGKHKFREGLALVAIVGSGINQNPVHSYRFYEELKNYPVEFFWQAEDGISLVAVLRHGPTRRVIQSLHQSLFCADNLSVWNCSTKEVLLHAG